MRWLEKLREPFLQHWFALNGYAYFAILCLLYFSLNLVMQTMVIQQIAAFEVLQQRGERNVFDVLFGLQFASIPLFLAWKITLCSLSLWIGCFLFGYRITFSNLWKMTMILELFFILPYLFKIVLFLTISTDPDYYDVVNFYPMSVSSLFTIKEMSPKWIYPLKALNVFELFYWGLLVAGIYWVGGKKLKTSALIVACSYVFLFFSWLLLYVAAFR